MRYHAPMEDEDNELLTLKQAEARIGISAGTLVIQARKGVLKARKMGNTYVVTAGELKRYEREHKGKPGPRPTKKDS